MGNPGDKYTIQILNGGGESSAKKTLSRSTSNGGGKSSATEALISGSVVARELRSIGHQVVAYSISTVGLTTGNMVSQQRLQTAMGLGMKAIAYGTAIATGNAAAVAVMAISDTLSTVQSVNTFNLKNRVESESLALSRERAGVAFNQSRLGAAK